MRTSESATEKREVSIMDRPLRVLHLEDNLDDRFIIQQWFSKQGIAADFIDAQNRQDFASVLSGPPSFDIILSDMTLSGFDGMSALRMAQEKCPHVPFVFVTGSIGEDVAIQTMRDGATDYVLKDRMARLIPAVQRAIRESVKEEKSRQSQEKIQEQASLLDRAQDAIFVKDMDNRIQYWNQSAERIYGWPASRMIGRDASELIREDHGKYTEAQQKLLKSGNWSGEFMKMNRAGEPLIVQTHWTLVKDESGKPKRVLVIDTDITEKKSIEAKFLRAQRMDSIGALAGGIAHDLNNAIAPVIMGAELLRGTEDPKDRHRFLDIITSNAQRATNLVKQILNFARGSGGQWVPVDVAQLVGEIGKMILDTFPKSIRFSIAASQEAPWLILGDTTELHQVLLNLCVNARDAMPQGGQLTLSACNRTLGAEELPSAGAQPGPYVILSVADSGPGIPPEVLPHIFEPFFSTKAADKGTGLGLSTVAGIVKHHGGFIDVQTHPGQGTEFKAYFPAVPTAHTASALDETGEIPTGNGELILVIDDEETLVEITKTMLETFGYRAITAQHGLQGVERFNDRQKEVKLVITDSDMPYLDGLGTIQMIRKLNADIPIIMASGSENDTQELRKADICHLTTLGKPYTLKQLLSAVYSSLQKNKNPSRSSLAVTG